MTKEEAIKKVSKNGLELEFLGTFQGDKDVVESAIAQNKDAIKYASDELKNDMKFMLNAIQHYGEDGIIQFAGDDLKENYFFKYGVAEIEANKLIEESKELDNDVEFRREEIIDDLYSRDTESLEHASEEILDDREFAEEVVEAYGLALKYLPDKFQNDEEIALLAIQRNSLALEYVGDDLKNNKTFLLKTELEQYQNDRDFVIDAIKDDINAVNFINDRYNTDLWYEIIDEDDIYEENDDNIFNLMYECLGDKGFVKVCCETHNQSRILQYVADDVAILDEIDPYSFNYPEDYLDLINDAIKINPISKYYADEDFIDAAGGDNDKYIYVEGYGFVDKYEVAQDYCRGHENDKEFILNDAVEKLGRSVVYGISEDLWWDEDFLLDLIGKNTGVLYAMSECDHMLTNKDFVLKAFLKSEDTKLCMEFYEGFVSNDMFIDAAMRDDNLRKTVCDVLDIDDKKLSEEIYKYIYTKRRDEAIVEKDFKEVTKDNYDYDLYKANEHNKKLMEEQVLAKNLPDIERDFVEKNNYGCCLHYAMYLFDLLREDGIKCYIAMTSEPNENNIKTNDNHVSVCYLINDDLYIADPVSAIIEREKDPNSKEDFSKIKIDSFIAKATQENHDIINRNIKDYEKGTDEYKKMMKDATVDEIRLYDPYGKKGEELFFGDFCKKDEESIYEEKISVIGDMSEKEFAKRPTMDDKTLDKLNKLKEETDSGIQMEKDISTLNSKRRDDINSEEISTKKSSDDAGPGSNSGIGGDDR